MHKEQLKNQSYIFIKKIWPITVEIYILRIQKMLLKALFKNKMNKKYIIKNCNETQRNKYMLS